MINPGPSRPSSPLCALPRAARRRAITGIAQPQVLTPAMPCEKPAPTSGSCPARARARAKLTATFAALPAWPGGC